VRLEGGTGRRCRLRSSLFGDTGRHFETVGTTVEEVDELNVHKLFIVLRTSYFNRAGLRVVPL